MTDTCPRDGDRVEAIAALYRDFDGQLHRVVRRRASSNPAIVDDACAHAWLKLLTTQSVDLRPPRWPALAWLTTTAVRRAWHLEHTGARVSATDAPALERAVDAATPTHAPGLHELVEQRQRLDIVAELPERPRRFLLRLALGYSYREIAAAEGASHTTTNKQIARAKRMLRALDADHRGGETHPPTR